MIIKPSAHDVERAAAMFINRGCPTVIQRSLDSPLMTHSTCVSRGPGLAAKIAHKSFMIGSVPCL